MTASRHQGAREVVHLVNGVDTPAVGDRARIRRELGLEGPVVGFVGSGNPWHGGDQLPALLDALGPEWRGIAVGGAVPPHPRLIATGRVVRRDLSATYPR